jgi:signal peptidase I
MEKTVLAGDHVIVNKFVFAPRIFAALDHWLPRRPVRRGDLIVFKFPEDPRRDFVKRAVALPGDTIEIRDKTVLVNGQGESAAGAYHSDARGWPTGSSGATSCPSPRCRRRRTSRWGTTATIPMTAASGGPCQRRT